MKYEYKAEKYKDILANIRMEEKDYTVDQITLDIDSLGGQVPPGIVAYPDLLLLVRFLFF